MARTRESIDDLNSRNLSSENEAQIQATPNFRDQLYTYQPYIKTDPNVVPYNDLTIVHKLAPIDYTKW